MAFWGVVAFALANTVVILRLLIGRLGMIPIKHHCYVFLTYYCARNGLSLGPSSLLRHHLPSRTDYDSYTSF
jgi:hypothetical protein